MNKYDFTLDFLDFIMIYDAFLKFWVFYKIKIVSKN